VTESLTPRSYQAPEIRYQPSLLSIPSAASTVAPEPQAPVSLHRGTKPTQWRKLWFFTAVSAFLGTAAAGALQGSPGLHSHIHSGSPSFKKSTTGSELLWKKSHVTVYLDESLSKLGPQANDAVVQAFGQWIGSDPKLPALSFDTDSKHADPKQDGKNTVSYGPITVPGHEHDVAITITYANDKTGEIVEADVILNARYPMAVLTPRAAGPAGPAAAGPAAGPPGAREAEAMDCQNPYDVQNVATHEVGHFFGLGEDMTERGSTMFLSIDQCETHKRVLTSTDVGAVSTLYASASPSEPEGGAGSAGCSFGGPPTARGAVGVLGLVFGLTLLRRRRGR